MRPRSTSGQSSVEYIAVVALVAIVFAVAGSFTLQGRAIAAATVGQLKRGLCIVEGHDCPEAHPPCAVSSRGTSDDWHVDIAVVRIGGGRSAIVEHMSDGRTLVTLADHMDLGATGGFGADLKLGDKLAMGGEVRAAVLASLGTGTTYEVTDDRTADELIRTMRRERTDPNFWKGLASLTTRVSPPISRYRSLDLTGSANLKLLSGEIGGGGSEDLVTGRRTVYLKGSASLDVEHVAAAGGGGGEAKLALTLDRHNNPVDLMLLGTGNLHASSDLPGLLQPIAGYLPSGESRTWQAEAHLDLTQPGRAKAVLGSLANPSKLVRMIVDEGTVEVDTYGTNEDAIELGGHVKAGLSLGGEISHTTSTRRLLSAMEHTPEGFWVPRYDCLASV
jgi:hypothetical protein